MPLTAFNFTVPFPYKGKEFSACVRVRINQDDHGIKTTHMFTVTIGDYLQAQWTSRASMSFENRSGVGYREDFDGYKLKDVTAEYLRDYLVPKIFQEFCPSGSFLTGTFESTSGLTTPQEINALPPNIRAYIHDLESRCDPSGDVQRIASLEEQVKGLTARLASQKRQELVTLTAGALSGLCVHHARLPSSELSQQAKDYANSTWYALPKT